MTKKFFFTGSLLLIITVLSTACQQSGVKHHKTTAMDSIAVVPFQLEQGGWGYKINLGTKTYIYQDIIPAIPGRHIFQSKEDAQKVGNLMAAKMKQMGGGLPEMSKQELLDLKIAGVE